MDTVTKTPRIGRHSPRITDDSRRGSEEISEDVPRRMFQGMPETPSPPRNSGRRSSSTMISPLGHRFVDAPSPTHNQNHHRPHHGHGHGRKNSISQDVNDRTRLLPPTTPKSRNNEVFMSPSPKLKSPHVSKDSEKKPIKEISNELKTRLNYALMKLQNGWVDKTLPELEHALTTTPSTSTPTTATSDVGYEKENMMMYDVRLQNNNKDHRSVFDQMNLGMSPRRRSTYVNQFANDTSDMTFSLKNINKRSPRARGGTRAGSGTAVKQEERETDDASMEDGSDGSDGKDDEMNSAHSAFLKALSSPTKKTPSANQHTLPVSPLRWTNNKPKPLPLKLQSLDTSTTSRNSDPEDKSKDAPDTSGPPSEVEAIETLMSLASPKKSVGTLDEALVSKRGDRTTPTYLRSSANKEAKDDHSDVETEIDEEE
ncbi:Protein SRL3 [Nakaseomyces bracarensis]|uniref:Protein SRL3 n=1 Tax=Nakaseomyces bracarensis TaxID=273131 RepID=A0ABR4NMN5_9SACH